MKLTTVRRWSLFLSLAALGCGAQSGPELGYVEGVITLDDEPASLAIIEFQPKEGGGSPSVGFADANGRYSLQFSGSRRGALIGTHTVRVTLDDDPSPDNPTPYIDLPAKYNKRSELVAEVKPGRNRHDMNLTLNDRTGKTSTRQ